MGGVVGVGVPKLLKAFDESCLVFIDAQMFGQLATLRSIELRTCLDRMRGVVRLRSRLLRSSGR